MVLSASGVVYGWSVVDGAGERTSLMQFNINKGNGVSTCPVGRNRFLLGERAQYEIVQSNKSKSNPHLLDLIEAREVCENWVWYSKNKDV